MNLQPDLLNEQTKVFLGKSLDKLVALGVAAKDRSLKKLDAAASAKVVFRELAAKDSKVFSSASNVEHENVRFENFVAERAI